jgi:hypothetical protein
MIRPVTSRFAANLLQTAACASYRRRAEFILGWVACSD